MLPSRSRRSIEPGVTAVITPRSSRKSFTAPPGAWRITSARIIRGPKKRSIIARGSANEPWATQKKAFTATRRDEQDGEAAA